MGRVSRLVLSGDVLIRQKGSFFVNQAEMQIYSEILHLLATTHNSFVYGYELENTSVVLFIKTKNVSKFMQVLNATFIRRRNSLRNAKAQSDLQRYDIKEISVSEFDDVLALIAKHGGYVYREVNKELDLFKKIEIEKFRKRNHNKMKIVALNAKDHSQLSYHQDAVPDMPFFEVLANEMTLCERDLPVVFTNDVVPRLVALLGREMNVTIDANYSGYVPVSIRNYPFSLAQVGEENVLCIDENAPNFVGGGEKLFIDGKPSKFLQHSISVMKQFNSELLTTQNALIEIKKAGILTTKELTVTVDDKKVVLVKGFSVVSKKKLYELDDATLARFVRNGYIDFISSHLRSLTNLENLANRILENESK